MFCCTIRLSSLHDLQLPAHHLSLIFFLPCSSSAHYLVSTYFQPRCYQLEPLSATTLIFLATHRASPPRTVGGLPTRPLSHYTRHKLKAVHSFICCRLIVWGHNYRPCSFYAILRLSFLSLPSFRPLVRYTATDASVRFLWIMIRVVALWWRALLCWPMCMSTISRRTLSLQKFRRDYCEWAWKILDKPAHSHWQQHHGKNSSTEDKDQLRNQYLRSL